MECSSYSSSEDKSAFQPFTQTWGKCRPALGLAEGVWAIGQPLSLPAQPQASIKRYSVLHLSR